MKSNLIRIICGLGGFAFARWFTRYQPKIIMYHRFSESPEPNKIDRHTFCRHLDLLQRNFNIISLNVLVSSLQRNRPLPKNSIVLTIDDGYLDFYNVAYPELKDRSLPATLFVTTRFIDQEIWLWPDMLRYTMEQSFSNIYYANFNGKMVHHNSEKDTSVIWMDLMQYLMPLPLSGKYDWINENAKLNNVSIPAHPTAEYAAVNWKQIREMAENRIEIGAHTLNHPSLTAESLSDAAGEINRCRDSIIKNVGDYPLSFCYPNGEASDYNSEIEKLVKLAGYNSAVVAHAKKVSLSNYYALPRFSCSLDEYHMKKVINGVQWMGTKMGLS